MRHMRNQYIDDEASVEEDNDNDEEDEEEEEEEVNRGHVSAGGVLTPYLALICLTA
jgi:hypothetical protein